MECAPVTKLLDAPGWVASLKTPTEAVREWQV